MTEKTLQITPDVVEAWEELELATTPEDRMGLTVQLAEIYSQYHDSSDPDIPQNFMDAADAFDSARVAYGQAATKLGILVVRALRAAMITTQQKEVSH
jgi:hypothetical protein